MGVKFCPGQNTQFWKSDDIFEVTCPHCKAPIEFFKDDVKQKCKCGKVVFNPRLDLGCAVWCPVAADCVGYERMRAIKKSAQPVRKITPK